MTRLCRCGHSRGPHEHYGGTTYCWICPPGVCSDYRPQPPLWRQLLRYLTRKVTRR
jgi:hypothetical protein